MDRDPKNKVVVVTGGAQGIGFAISDQFLITGAKVVIILDIGELGPEAAETLNNKHGPNKAHFIKCNVVTDLETVIEQIYENYGKVDVLVNNAGVSAPDVDVVIDVNLRAVMKWSFKFWERMRQDKTGNGGTIINISSIYGITVLQHFPAYHGTKFGVIGFSKSLGHEFNFKRSGVRVIVLCPGYTKTNLCQLPKDITFDDEGLRDSVEKTFSEVVYQSADIVGKAAVEIFKKVNSGTVWRIENSEPVAEVL